MPEGPPDLPPDGPQDAPNQEGKSGESDPDVHQKPDPGKAEEKD
jgi:hypothetical protein